VLGETGAAVYLEMRGGWVKYSSWDPEVACIGDCKTVQLTRHGDAAGTAEGLSSSLYRICSTARLSLGFSLTLTPHAAILSK
jgi:hypothetical protein